jgi:hypothetical protein
MAVRLAIHELAAGRGDAGGAGFVGIGEDGIAGADIERVAQENHAEGLADALDEGVADFGDAVAIGIAQQRG